MMNARNPAFAGILGWRLIPIPHTFDLYSPPSLTPIPQGSSESLFRLTGGGFALLTGPICENTPGREAIRDSTTFGPYRSRDPHSPYLLTPIPHTY